MKSKGIVLGILALAFAVSSLAPVNTQRASAGQSDFILPYYNGYVDESSTMISQDTVIDMSAYYGVGAIGFDSGVIRATTKYKVSTTQTDATFYLPYAGTIEELNELKIALNDAPVSSERLYGEMPKYMAGLNVFSITIVDAIESVQPLTVNEGIGKLYTFATSETPLEFSFKKSETQTVLHSGVNWSSYGVDGYVMKCNTNTNEGNPYRLFVTEGELEDFTSNVTYMLEDVTYQNYVDYYVTDEIETIGEEYRGVIYSRFNRSLDGRVDDAFDVIFNFNSYVFALMKVSLPKGQSTIVVDSVIHPLVNALYNPYIYTLRTVSAYPQTCAYSLSIIASENLPCLIEENIGLDNLNYTANQQIVDGYYIMCADTKPDNVLDNNSQQKDNAWILYLGVGLGGVILLGTAIYMFLSWRKSK